MKYGNCTEYWLNTENMTLRGEFEGMYHDIDDPWGCNAAKNSVDNRIFLELIFGEKRYTNILDVGCGLGGSTSNLLLRNGGGEVVGCDISANAIQKAIVAYPQVTFVVKNILTDTMNDVGAPFALIVLSEVLWYVLEDVKSVFEKIRLLLLPMGILAIHQYFPDQQRYGKQVIDGIEGFEKFIRMETRFKFSKKIVSYGETEGKVLLTLLERID